MNGLRTSMVLILSCTGPVLSAAESVPGEQALALASCQGRYAAVAAEAGPDRDGLEAARLRRDMLAAMLDALTRDATDGPSLEVAVLRLRLDEQRTTRHLLAEARFGADPRRASHAAAVLDRRFAACDRLVPGRALPAD